MKKLFATLVILLLVGCASNSTVQPLPTEAVVTVYHPYELLQQDRQRMQGLVGKREELNMQIEQVQRDITTDEADAMAHGITP
jgi:hypothetical protein